MSAQSDPVLFEAICTPARSLDRRGAILVGTAVVGLSLLVGLVFSLVGAWPVLGFTGGESLLVIVLMTLHRRWARRSSEVLVLTETALTISRTNGRGRREEMTLDPYWTRLRLEERPGQVCLLLLRQRHRSIEIGRLLGDDQKRSLAAALDGALRRYREPVFDNPQLRDG